MHGYLLLKQKSRELAIPLLQKQVLKIVKSQGKDSERSKHVILVEFTQYYRILAKSGQDKTMPLFQMDDYSPFHREIKNFLQQGKTMSM